VFSGLTTQHTLTAAMHVLPSWLVRAYEAEKDLDNLRLVDLGAPNPSQGCRGTVRAVYMLNHLFLEGQIYEFNERGQPLGSPAGVYLALQKPPMARFPLPTTTTTDTDAHNASMSSQNRTATDEQQQQQEPPPLHDTQVMRNLGYFQLKANPGVFVVEIAYPDPATDDNPPPAPVEISSFFTQPHVIKLQKPSDADAAKGGDKKKSGTSGQEDKPGFWKSLTGLFKGENKTTDVSSSCPTVHIFSLASGHLYERLLRIMIKSVRQNTRCPLHFWFIDNFLSPKFRELISYMAARYSFDYQFVTYKWPSWLNPQTEKQRLIWAYKILFLDVLFPTWLNRVIYIDADQIVRADVRELWDMDLKGKVYGYTPFCSEGPGSNAATEGFRFWKQGYWKNHLGDLSYHISALYVVDLKEFRRQGAGDRLRSVYNQLSRDKNSLANLDQDLPNYAQHDIPIFSLPQEWLWCETWCANETMPMAKTIDLCNNPLTKEPKLHQAKRIVKEWTDYDEEIRAFELEVENMFSLDQSSVANDTISVTVNPAAESPTGSSSRQSRPSPPPSPPSSGQHEPPHDEL